ncbi:hypothetical protein IAU60_002085 [Kwoniella sp. DSM 27419]
MSKATERPPATIISHPSAIICQDTELRGDITVGEGCVIHPKASIQALGGPIVLGRNCVVEELSVIINRNPSPLHIGDSNQFMVGSRVESPSIGSGNVFQPRCQVSTLVAISDHCTIGAGCALFPSIHTPEGSVDTLPSRTVVYGDQSERRVWDGTGLEGDLALKNKAIEYLREIVPK